MLCNSNRAILLGLAPTANFAGSIGMEYKAVSVHLSFHQILIIISKSWGLVSKSSRYAKCVSVFLITVVLNDLL